MSYLSIFLINTISLVLYYKIATWFNIADMPNERSSHDYPTIRGAGVIFLITGLCWGFSDLSMQLYFSIGLLLLGLISLLDDIFTLKNSHRFIVQILAVILAVVNLGLQSSNILWLALILMLYLGWVNAFNFMDGINAITSFYTISILVPLFLAIELYSLPYSELIISIFISVLVFMFLNVRTRALAFCGDVGAASLSYILAYLIIILIVETGKFEFILFGSIYGIDSIFTIVRRLKKRQNIFHPHRSHLYQLLSNELSWNYLHVSLLYSFCQIVISLLILGSIHLMPQYSLYIAISILLLLSIIYLYSLKQVNTIVNEKAQGGL